MASFVLIALVISTISLGVVLDKSSGTSVVATPGAAAAAPAFDLEPNRPKRSEPATRTHPNRAHNPQAAVHKATFNIVEKQVDIAPGVSQLMWTYNGQVPGPTLRGKVGDRFEITLVNKARRFTRPTSTRARSRRTPRCG